MGFFKRKKDIVDLGSLHKKRERKKEELRESFGSTETTQDTSSNSNFYGNQSNSSGLGFLGNMANASQQGEDSGQGSNSYKDLSQPRGNSLTPNERKRKLANRLKKITESIESLSNQIYHLQQRLDVMEKKMNINNFY